MYRYHDSVPEFLQAFAETSIMTRLRNVGMNCGCEYTSFPRFQNLSPYSRFDHSMGVALIVWHFTQDKVQTIAGQMHDIATPVFAHVVDFMRGDYLKQEATEESTREMIESSEELQRLLKHHGLTTDDVCDYHMYPVADNESPRLSADRLEYTMGNSVNFGFCGEDEIRQIYDDLVVGTNEDGQPELMFKSRQAAERFADLSLQCSKVYVSDEDRYSMQMLSEILALAVRNRVIEESDLYLTEPEVIAKLVASDKTGRLWNNYRAYSGIVRATSPDDDPGWRQIVAKKRYIDPMVQNVGRVSGFSHAFGDALSDYLATTFEYWCRGSRKEASGKEPL